VSIGVPVYNGERFLAAALDSLLAQTFDDFELIIADNASTDDTAEICRSYEARDPRVRYVRNERNIGVYRNYNRVFRLAVGEYFKFAAADDFCHRELVEKCVEVLDAEPGIVATYARTRFVDSDGNWLALHDPGWHLMADAPSERLKYVLVSGHWVNLPFGLLRSKALARTRLFPLYAGGDCRLLGELSLKGKFFEIPEYLFFRRIHDASSSQNADHDWQSRFFKGVEGHVELPLWHVCVDHLGTILQSDLPPKEKLSCAGIVIRRMASGRRELFGELQRAGLHIYRTVSR
jgi:glycosyltransferase involved in cell wall biosynthesis